MRRGNSAWLVVLAGVSAALHVGKLPPAVGALRDGLGISWVEAGFLLSLVQLAGMLLGLPVGLLADTLGLRRTMVAGSALLSVAGTAGAFTGTPSSLLVLRALEGLGFLLATMPAPALVRQLVPPERVNLMLGAWGAYMPVGTALGLLAGPWLLGSLGWRAWWLCPAMVSAAMTAALILGLPAGERAKRAPNATWLTLAVTVRSRGPWLVAVSFAAYSAQWLAMIGFLPSIYSALGLAAAWTGPATALAAFVNMLGNVGAGRLLHRGWPAHRLLSTGFVAMGTASVLAFTSLPLPVPAVGITQYAAVLVFSALGGLIPATLFAQAVHLSPAQGSVPSTVGWMQQWSSAGQFAGPPIVAWMATLAGGWHTSWVFMFACASVGLLMALCIRGHARSQPVTP